MKDTAIVYNDIDELDYIIKNFKTIRQEYDLENDNPYEPYNPTNVMNTFQKVFLL